MTDLTTTINLNEALTRQNPWFTDDKALAEDPSKPKRAIFPLVKDRVVNRNLITAVVGLRRVGKTTLIKQVINDLLLEGHIDRRLITYFAFEDWGYFRQPEALSAIIEAQLARFPHAKQYFFLDEIQYVDGWNAVLKKYFDLYSQLKFVVSGSASLFVSTSAHESLAGRIQEVPIYPLGFGEYLDIHEGIRLPPAGFLDTEPLLEAEPLLESHFLDYLAWGEFPYVPLLPGWQEKQEYLLSFVIGKIIESDLPSLRRIYGPAELKALVRVLLDNAGQVIQLQNLGSDVALAQKTLREYLALLEQTFLFTQIYNKGVGFRERSLRQRKVYPTSTNALVLSAATGLGSETFNLRLGQFVENFVFNYLHRQITSEVYFFRQRQVKEVDFIVPLPNATVPIEVKYQNTLRPADYQSLLYYCHKERLKEAVVITKTAREEREIDGVKLRFIPAHFLV